jgi:adenylate kinase
VSAPTIIVICGLSGVGKTYLINRFVAGNGYAARLSAGSIIAEARNITDPEFLRKLPANELDRSQELLIAGLPRILRNVTAPLVLLDAHTVIDNGSEGLYVVTDAVFAALRLHGIIHVEAEPEVIARQRDADTERARPHRSVKVLSDQQQVSARRAQEVAAGLNVWCARVRSGEVHAFEKLLTARLS